MICGPSFAKLISRYYKTHCSLLSTCSLLVSNEISQKQKDSYGQPHIFFPFRGLKESLRSSEHLSSSSFCLTALKMATTLARLPEGKQLHCHIIKMGYDHSQSVQNQLLCLYVKCGFHIDARQLFDEMSNKNLVAWNIMISGSSDGRLFYFKKLWEESLEPNHISYIGALSACIESNNIEIGKQLHCSIIKANFQKNSFVGSSLIDLYAKCKYINDARTLFDKLHVKDLVCWNVMISCYVLNDLPCDALKLYKLLESEGIRGDCFTLSSMLSCSSISSLLEFGRQLHGLVITLSLDCDILVVSGLVDMYAKNGNITDARKVFDGMYARNVVSWTTMIVGYGKKGDGKEGLHLLRQMVRDGFKPDELTFASILSSCGNIAAFTESVQVHAFVMKSGFEDHISIKNSLISSYSKCGCLRIAIHLFNSIVNPNLVSWTSMIGAYASQGFAKEAIETFENMLKENVRPDHISFIGLLSACSHAGLVHEGLNYFDSMINVHHIKPNPEHYTCLVDLLGRAGHIEEAHKILCSVPDEHSSTAMGAFAGSCKIHSEFKLAKWAVEKLFDLEPSKSVNYKLMSNLYASNESWMDVSMVRKIMRDNCYATVPGCSWIEICGKVRSFVSGDVSGQNVQEMYLMLDTVIRLMQKEYIMT